MPLYTLRCTTCGEQEVYSRKVVSFDIGFCPQCGKAAPKKIELAGPPSFHPYWTEAFPGKSPIRVESPSQERALCRQFGWERVS